MGTVIVIVFVVVMLPPAAIAPTVMPVVGSRRVRGCQADAQRGHRKQKFCARRYRFHNVALQN
jgi:hypothetical protein